MIIAGVDFRDATTATLKEVNTAMNVYGRRKSVRRKRTKQLIAILLAVTMITLATAKPYQEAKATGLGEAAAGAAAGFGVLSPGGQVLVLTGVIGLACMYVTSQDFRDLSEEGKKHAIEKAGNQIKEDVYNHTVQALNNNVSAAEQQRDNAAHARNALNDFWESASAGVIDTTSEAWDWFRNFCGDVRTALAGDSAGGSHVNIGGYPAFEDGEYLVGRTPDYPNGTWYATFSIVIEGVALAQECKNAVLCRRGKYVCAVSYPTGKVLSGTIGQVKMIRRTYNYESGKLKHEYSALNVGTGIGVGGIWDYTGLGMNEYSIPAWEAGAIAPAAPSGTTDVPGVSNLNDYESIGSDLPYTRPEGAWDICDPNGKQGQVSIGADIPGKLGYDDWYDLLGGVATGDTTWEEVANASDVITIGSDLANDYSPSNAKDWSAYHDGTIVGYDVDAAGNVTVTFEDGTVISIPQEYVSGMEWVNEQDKAQELDKDTALPVSGSLAYPLPAIQDPAVPADPQDPGGGSGDIKIDDDAKDYTLDFRKLFPFCIPFDIYKAVKLLDATPTAPVVHYKFYYTKSKSYTIDINLNKFNSVAAILRRMECLLFIIGLATATRRIYLRG